MPRAANGQNLWKVATADGTLIRLPYRELPEEAKAKARAAQRRYSKENKFRILATRHKVSEAEVLSRFEAAGNRCEICRADPDGTRHRGKTQAFHLCLDHDHTTKKIRGVLCRSCNKGIGIFEDRPDLLREAIKYLSKYKELQNVGK